MIYMALFVVAKVLLRVVSVLHCKKIPVLAKIPQNKLVACWLNSSISYILVSRHNLGPFCSVRFIIHQA